MKKSSLTFFPNGRLVFILGHPLGHTLSPAMQNAAFKAVQLPWVYLPLDIAQDQVGTVLDLMKDLPAQGANVTVPYKGAVIPFLDEVEKDAKWLGSVNTLYRKGSKLCGTSTDGEGFLRSLGNLRAGLKGSRGLLVGAGGAAKAVAGALLRSGVKGFYLANRSPEKAKRLMKTLKERKPSLELGLVSIREAEKLVGRCDWVIQATSLGLKKGDPSPLVLVGARRSLWVVDLIYNRETAFLRQAQSLGLRRRDGIGMLLHQGALSFERWTGKKAPLGIMRRTLLNSLG